MSEEKKQRRDEGGGGDDGGGPSAPFWMVTYSDMVTLLLTFFVMLLAMANFEEVGRVEAVFESIRLALGVGAPDVAKVGVDVEQENHDDVTVEDKLEVIKSRIRVELDRKFSDEAIPLTKTPQEIRVSLPDEVLFAPGSAELHPAVYRKLSDLGVLLSKEPVSVKVEGHTDETGAPEDNWELSSARAVSVVLALQRAGMPGSRLEARGMGEYYPANQLEGDANWDRRVDLVIKSDSALAFDAVHAVERLTTGGRDGG